MKINHVFAGRSFTTKEIEKIRAFMNRPTVPLVDYVKIWKPKSIGILNSTKVDGERISTVLGEAGLDYLPLTGIDARIAMSKPDVKVLVYDPIDANVFLPSITLDFESKTHLKIFRDIVVGDRSPVIITL